MAQTGAARRPQRFRLCQFVLSANFWNRAALQTCVVGTRNNVAQRHHLRTQEWRKPVTLSWERVHIQKLHKLRSPSALRWRPSTLPPDIK